MRTQRGVPVQQTGSAGRPLEAQRAVPVEYLPDQGGRATIVGWAETPSFRTVSQPHDYTYGLSIEALRPVVA